MVNADAVSKEYLKSDMDEQIRHLEMLSVLFNKRTIGHIKSISNMDSNLREELEKIDIPIGVNVETS
jgi:hypothetical protein